MVPKTFWDGVIAGILYILGRMNRVDRLLALILYLQSKRVVTAEELARHFELSIRTVYRDLAALGEAGVPIVAEAGVGYALLKGYHLPPVNFTAEEANALVTGGMLVGQFADASLKAQMGSALQKVRAILPCDHQDRVDRLERSMATTATVKSPVQADLSLLQQALAARRVLQCHYQGAGQAEAIQRTVEPLGLMHYLERWHLIAWCRDRKDYRDFRTDRMTRVAMLPETFEPRAGFAVADYIRSLPQPTLRARVKFTALSADRAKREWWLGIVAEQPASKGVVLTLATVDWEHLVDWLVSFGTTATVIAPDDLRNRLVAAARVAISHHTKKGKVS
jgi:predicted DNA-binding transcriptional regulator YafY